LLVYCLFRSVDGRDDERTCRRSWPEETKEGGRARRTSTTIYLQVREARNAPVGGGGRGRHGYPCEVCVGGGVFGVRQGMRQEGFSCCLLACWALVERRRRVGG